MVGLLDPPEMGVQDGNRYGELRIDAQFFTHCFSEVFLWVTMLRVQDVGRLNG